MTKGNERKGCFMTWKHGLHHKILFFAFAGIMAAVCWPSHPQANVAEWGNYAGATRCKSCHQPAYDIWVKGPHARALTNLEPRQRQDFRCRQCHTMVPDGFMENLASVQCESCHGAGRYYSESHVMKDKELREQLFFKVPDEKTCLFCHQGNHTGLKDWNYKEKLQKIKHW